jgi:1-acyl-sn-glycerol-3-phosphate acyltransferase
MNAALYDAARFALWAAFKTVWRLRARGTQNVPEAGGVIIACNHVSYLDPPVLGAASPRRIQYMAKQELFEIPVLGPAIAAVGAYPVDRHGSAAAAIRRSVEVLNAGGAIGIFPEGTRNRDGSAPVQRGVALLASIAKVPVVPARIVGTEHANRFARFEVYFGEPMQLKTGVKAGRDDADRFAEDVMRAIRTLPETYRGR